jgi:hypothetical protein
MDVGFQHVFAEPKAPEITLAFKPRGNLDVCGEEAAWVGGAVCVAAPPISFLILTLGVIS